MQKKNKLHSPPLKARVALAAVKGDRTIAQLAQELRVHPNLIYKWRKQLLDGAPSLFDAPARPAAEAPAAQEMAALYEQIGRRNRELEWLKKKADRLG
jgi:putative transposase